MHITHPIRRGIPAALALIALAAFATAPSARADEVIASDTPVAAAAGTAIAVPTAIASRPRTIVVTHHEGASVTLFAKGENIRRNLAPGSRAAVFTGLTAGRLYTVAVGGQPIGSVVALGRPTPAHSLLVRRAPGEGSVALSWRQTATAATGGDRVSFTVTATSPTAATITRTVTGARAATLSGLDPAALYSFTVTPRNSAGAGRATRATMAAPLGRTATPPVATTPTPPVATIPAPAAAPAPAPAPPAAPTTRTVYRCPDGFTETSAGLCRKTTPYTFTTKAYTYTWGVVGSHSEPDDYAANVGPLAQGPVCPWGGYYVEPGICRGATSHSVTDYGNVKDATPAGYTDDGTQWVKRDPIPAGYTDDGNQWVAIVAKEAVTVPA